LYPAVTYALTAVPPVGRPTCIDLSRLYPGEGVPVEVTTVGQTCDKLGALEEFDVGRLRVFARIYFTGST